MNAYVTISAEGAGELEIKKSKFISKAAYAASKEEAEAFIQAQRDANPKASHCCWAYSLGEGTEEVRFSDDGEPGGTAGQPIARAIQSMGLSYTVVTAVRYFGGIKLGASGLTRAYGRSAALALQNAKLCGFEERVLLSIELPYSYIELARRFVKEKGFGLQSESFESNYRISFSLPEESLNEVASHFTHRLSASGVHVLGKRYEKQES